MKLTRVENCGLQAVRPTKCLNNCATPKLSVILQPNQWFSSGQECAGGNSVSMLQGCLVWRGPAKGADADCQHTDLSTLASGSDQREGGLAGSGSEVEALLSKVNEGLNRKIPILKNGMGTSGVYTVRDGRRNVVAVFKPIDEEPTVAMNSGEGHGDRRQARAHSVDVARANDSCEPRRVVHERKRLAPRIGLYAGELCLREVAAYLLDSEGIHGVPTTTMCQMSNDQMPVAQQKPVGSPRIGSLQRFVQNNGETGNISCSKFSVFEVQKIALLDLRMLNSDRNEANILFKRHADDRISLIPIDHALSMPDKLEVYQSDLCWLEWPQSREPLCPQLAAYVARMDPEKDAAMLKERLGIRDECLLNLKIATVFLKKAVAKGLSLAKIACLMYRAKEFSKSPLEKLVEKTRLTYDFILRKVELSPRGVDLSPRSQAREAKKGLFTPQKLNRFSDNLGKPTPFDPREDLEALDQVGFLTPVKTQSTMAASMPLNIFPLSHSASLRPMPYVKLAVAVLSPMDSFSPAIEHLLAALPEVPTFVIPLNGFEMPTQDSIDSKSVSSSPWDHFLAPDFPTSATSQLPILEAISCGQRPVKTRKNAPRQARQTRHSEDPIRAAHSRSATQERRDTANDEVREKLCFLPNVKKSEQSLQRLFFECFELNVVRFLEEKARRNPRKYTMHLG